MQRTNKLVILVVFATVAALFLAAGFTIAITGDYPESWKPAAHGLIVVSQKRDAYLSQELEAGEAGDDNPQPASSADAARWLNAWPYRPSDGQDAAAGAPREFAARNTEVRCTGEPTGPDIIPDGNDVETMRAIRYRHECVFTKWKVWSGDTAEEHFNERHTVWVDENGFYHGRVDYWR